MNPRHLYAAVAVWCAVLFALAPSMYAQQAAAPKTGVPQDWSQRHIVFSRAALAQHPDLIYREPRVLHQAMQRWQVPNFGVFRVVDPLPFPAAKSGLDRDWEVTVLGGRLNANIYPAKFSFNPGAPPDCTNDYVVFGLNTASTGTDANLVAFNNLYAGTDPTGLCGTAPTVYFAYDTTTVTGGKITTSPILSEDGTKIAFVESVPANAGAGITAQSIFHVLTWTGGQGAIGAAAAPGTAMTSLTFSAAKNDTTSSPWIDYVSDTVYVGADSGAIYKITGVFKGTPTLAGAPWPITLSKNFALTPPVLDSGLGMLMVGSANGDLYQINTATDAVATLAVGKNFNKDILAAPIVDVTNGITFVVSANNGTSAVLVEVNTATLTQLAEANIGQGSSGGVTTVDLYEPAVDNNYFNDPTTGLIHLCGTGPADTTPYHYAFGFTEPSTRPIMNTAASISQQLLTSAAGCTGWTEFFNPNVGTGGTDFFFFGLTQDCTSATGGLPDGCLVSIANNGTPVTVTMGGGPSGIVTDNYSTAAQASSIYFTQENANHGYKFTQNGLQ